MFLFLIASVLFSKYYYGFTWIQILQGGRHHFLLLSYFFLRKTKKDDILWIVRCLFYITLAHAVLYGIQVMTNLPILPYGEAKIDEVTGIARYYNMPVFLIFFLFFCIIFPNNYLRIKFPKTVIAILLVALLCTQGRTMIALTIFCILIGLLYQRQSKKLFKNVIILGIIALPFADMLLARFDNKGETSSDIEEIVTGKFIKRAYSGDMRGGTMSYRFAWVYERMEYLSDRPIAENIFGLGMISDSQEDVVQQKYRFLLGLKNKETGLITQLVTPDIAYGNLITQFGYMGGLILLCIWVRLFVIYYKNRKSNELVFCTALLLFYYIVSSISGSTISTTGNLVTPFMFLSLINTQIPQLLSSYEFNNRENTLNPQKLIRQF